MHLLCDVAERSRYGVCGSGNYRDTAAGGDLRQYSDALANTVNMLKYIEQHPHVFGQEGLEERS
ncbi:hypothetical protein Fmac_015739 [Flemingia macrophylla]|uniref:Uncharacterized protein n=1 Tax=Flemingia macrophylla TaxID=520843 RepID=A0ABD1MFE2_9FABA